MSGLLRDRRSRLPRRCFYCRDWISASYDIGTPERPLCRSHVRLANLALLVGEGRRSDWLPVRGATTSMRVNHARMMHTHPHELGQERVGWQREVRAILALLRVRLWGGLPGAGEGGEGRWA